MKEDELNVLANHLGHDVKTHKDFYRLSSATVELTTVRSSILILSIKDLIHSVT